MSLSRDEKDSVDVVKGTFVAGVYGIEKTLSAHVTDDEVKGEEINQYFLNRRNQRIGIGERIRSEEKKFENESVKDQAPGTLTADQENEYPIFSAEEIEENTRVLNEIFKALLSKADSVKVEEGDNNNILITHKNKRYELENLMRGVDKSQILYDKKLINKYGNMMIEEDVGKLGQRFNVGQKYSGLGKLSEKINTKKARKYYKARMMGYVVKGKFIVSKDLSNANPVNGQIHIQCNAKGLEYKVAGSNTIHYISRMDLPYNFPMKLSDKDWGKLNNRNKNFLYIASEAIVKKEAQKAVKDRAMSTEDIRALESEIASVKKLKTLKMGEMVAIDTYTDEASCRRINWMLRNFKLKKPSSNDPVGLETPDVRHTLLSSLMLLSTLNQHADTTDYSIRGDYYMSVPLVEKKSGKEFEEQSVVSTALGSSSYNKSSYLKDRNTTALTVFNNPKGLNIDAMNVISAQNRDKREREFLKPPGIIKYEEIYVQTYELAALPEKYYLSKPGEERQRDKTQIRKGILYVDMKDDGLHYAVINPKGELVNTSIDKAMLKKILGDQVEIAVGCEPNALKPHLRKILNHTASLTHTHGEINVFSAKEITSKVHRSRKDVVSQANPARPQQQAPSRVSGQITPGNHHLNPHSTIDGLNNLVESLKNKADDKNKIMLNEVQEKLKNIKEGGSDYHQELDEIKIKIKEVNDAVVKTRSEARQAKLYGDSPLKPKF